MVWGEIPSAPSSELSALSKAWSSNPLHYFSTLEPVQSNNGEPNWGPNHATEHTQSSYWIKLARLPLTSRPLRWGIQDPEGSYQLIPVLSLLSRSGLWCTKLALISCSWHISSSSYFVAEVFFCVGGENEAWKFSYRCLLKLVCKPRWKKVCIQIQDICCGFALLPGNCY